MFGRGADKAGLVVLGVVGNVRVVSVVWLPVVAWFPCSWVALATALRLGLGFEIFLGGNGCLCLGGGRPPGDGIAALCLVILIGVRGGCWAIDAPFCAFCFGRAPGTITPTCQE